MCENCPEEEMKLVKLRFIGGKHKRGTERGPYRSFETNKIYMMRETYASLPYWEPIDKEGEEAAEVEIDFENTDKEVPSKSRGLTREYGKGGPPSNDDFILGMDEEALKYFIEGNGGKVDGRWGRDRLVEEAKKLQ